MNGQKKAFEDVVEGERCIHGVGDIWCTVLDVGSVNSLLNYDSSGAMVDWLENPEEYQVYGEPDYTSTGEEEAVAVGFDDGGTAVYLYGVEDGCTVWLELPDYHTPEAA